MSCKCIYKIKIKSDGSIEWYKARLVARGFTQEYAIDYAVIKMTSIRNLLAIDVTRQWPLYRINVKNAFLNSDISEVVYM